MDSLDDKRITEPSTSKPKQELALVVPAKRKKTDIILSAENRPVKLVKKPRIVLQEDEFTDDLQQIIIRDYFPEVPKLKAQQEYMDAVESNDIERIREIQLRYSSEIAHVPITKTVRKSNATEKRFDVDTDMDEVTSFANSDGQNIDADDSSKPGMIDLDKHTVQSFVDTFVSEDSKSFHDVMDYDAKKHRAMHEWIYTAEKKHGEECEVRAQPMILNADEQLVEARKPYFLRDRPADIDNWSYTARNSCIFGPEEAMPTAGEFINAVKATQKKVINKEATRVDVNLLKWDAKTRSSSNNFVAPKVDISGTEVDPRKRLNGGFDPIATPDPTIGPGESPLITWGQIDGTPFRLDGTDLTPLADGAPVFKLPQPTKREMIAHDMVDKIKQHNKEKRLFSMKMTEKLKNPRTNLSTMSRMAMMSPAAHKFATTKLGIRTRNTGTVELKASPAPFRLQPPSGSLSKTRPEPKEESMEDIINEGLLSVRKQRFD